MVITRFAPSPTGYLHIGGVRTALFSWLYAKQKGGQFILRIEDTDQERSTQESVNAILDGMAWLGLTEDQGPFYQMQRMERYQTLVQQLLDEGKAYYCYATPEELEAMREAQKARGEKPRYDGRYRQFTGTPPSGVKPVVRFKNPLEGEVSFEDAARGLITVSNKELDDLIILRSDGIPTYNFAVVVDDWDMAVTHVIRGDDHINNTPRQINLYHAFAAPVPTFAHLPMVLGEDGTRLSKRHGAVSVLEYQKMGYLPQALLNYLARLGWSYGDQEIFTLEELIEKFSLDRISRAPGSFNTEKLKWVNQEHIKAARPGDLVAHLMPFMDVDVSQGPQLEDVIPLFQERATTLVEMAASMTYFYQDFTDYEEAAAKKHLRPVAAEALQNLQDKLASLQQWHAPAIHQAIEDVCAELGIGMGKVGMPFRVAITGGGNSPGIDAVAALIGKERVLARIHKALEYIAQRGA